MNCVGLKQYSFDADYTTEKLDDGKYLIEQFKSEDIDHISRKESMQSVRGTIRPDNFER